MESGHGSQNLPAAKELQLGRLASNPGVVYTSSEPPLIRYKPDEPYVSPCVRLIDPRMETTERTKRSIW